MHTICWTASTLLIWLIQHNNALHISVHFEYGEQYGSAALSAAILSDEVTLIHVNCVATHTVMLYGQPNMYWGMNTVTRSSHFSILRQFPISITDPLPYNFAIDWSESGKNWCGFSPAPHAFAGNLNMLFAGNSTMLFLWQSHLLMRAQIRSADGTATSTLLVHPTLSLQTKCGCMFRRTKCMPQHSFLLVYFSFWFFIFDIDR